MSFSLLSVTFKALCRRWIASLLLVAVAAAGTVSAFVLNGLISRQEEALENTKKNTVISCVVTDYSGSSSGNLSMLSAFVEMLTGKRRERDCFLDDYVKNVRAMAGTPLLSPENHALRRILSIDSDPLLDPINGVSVEFYEGYSEEVLQGREMVCIVAPDMVTENGYIIVSPDENTEAEIKIVGILNGGPTGIIYCPFFMPFEEEISVAFYVNTCSFDIKDNTKLKESKDYIYEFFVVPDVMNKNDGLTFGVLVQDETYHKSLGEINSNLTMLRIMLPVLMIICGCIGFFAGFLMTKGRIREFATMRCIGMKKMQIFFLVIGELLFLAAFGMLLGGGIGFIIEGNLSPKAISDSAIITAVYIIGTAIAALRIVRINIMKLSNKEE
ncbi:MAG: FtsX-like permease family protein [Oscillospiraceae bacterium]|nr:FtsX-like permease family protein [Oscillospiraceae bacterium]